MEIFVLSWRDLVGLGLVLVGIVLFLYGANYFDALIGWAGIFLVGGGIIAEVILKLIEAVRKKGEGLEAVKL
jgi:divalent metal cation (Fe/Co/Zn/Cd) transporter